MEEQNRPLVSIVMAYYNRIDQLKITLETISHSNYKNFEIIIIDDGSEEKHDLKNLIFLFNFQIKLLIVKKEQKTWINPCIPFNLGFLMSKGEYIIIQNPEVAHVGDVIEYVAQNLHEGKYLTFSVFSSPSFNHNNEFKNFSAINKEDIYNNFVNKINYNDFQFDYEYYKNYYEDIKNMNFVEACNHWNNIGIIEGRFCNASHIYHPKAYIQWKGWYNHPIHNNRPYHFLSAVSRKDLIKIGGFDPIFKDGLWYDDDDFLNRIAKVSKVENVNSDQVFGIHLYHEMGSADQMNQKNFKILNIKNKKLKRANIKFNIIHVNIGNEEECKKYEIYNNKVMNNYEI